MNKKNKTTITPEEINRIVWSACDTFRGAVDPAQYKDYILATLFWKYISDTWKRRYKELTDEYGEGSEQLKGAMELEDFIIPPKCDFTSLYEQRNASDIGDRISKALAKIESENGEKFYNLFRNINFNSENLGESQKRNSRLNSLLEDFHKLPDLGDEKVIEDDIIGNSYLYLIEHFASDAGKKAGEFYTPRKISKLVALLADPRMGEKICDPACGSGSMLLEIAKVLKEKKISNYSLFGMEVNDSTWTMARMNFLLSPLPNAGDVRLEKCDSLADPQFMEGTQLMKFEVVVANPPFSLKKWGAESAASDPYGRFHRGIPPKGRGDWAFLTHMIETTTPQKGRVVVVVPHGVLFRGAMEGLIRRSLLEDNLLDTVIGLAPNLFQTTSIPVAILVFDKSRQSGGVNEKRKNVLFIDASKDFVPGKNQNSLSEEHIDKIRKVRKNRKNVKGYAHLASFAEIEKNEFNLNIARYVDTFVEEKPEDVGKLQQEIEDLEKELTVIRADMKGHLLELEKLNPTKNETRK